MSVVIDNPSTFQVQEELRAFGNKVGADVTIDETTTGSDRVRIDTGSGVATLVKDGENGHLKLESAGDIETFDIGSVGRIEFADSTTRIIVDMVDFGL